MIDSFNGSMCSVDTIEKTFILIARVQTILKEPAIASEN